MKHRLQIPALFLAFLFAFTGCGRGKTARTEKPADAAKPGIITADDLPENIGATETLENVYRHVQSFLPDDVYLIPDGVEYDAESGILRCMTEEYAEEVRVSRYLEIQNDGTVLLEIPVSMPEGYRVYHACM